MGAGHFFSILVSRWIAEFNLFPSRSRSVVKIEAGTRPNFVDFMGERCNRTAEVRGSIPLGSTTRATDGAADRGWGLM